MSTEAASEPRDAARHRAKSSLRTCIVTRAELPPSQMIRFVPGPDGVITPDLARRLPGRGVWVTCSAILLTKAIKTKAFAKSLKRPVSAASDLTPLVDQLMLRRTIEALSLANKAGSVVTGFAKVEAELSRGSVVALLHAVDAAEDGSRKLDRKWQAIARDLGREPRIVGELTTTHLDLATGKENVVHAAIGDGGAGLRFLTEVERLGRYRQPASSSASDCAAV